jgi:hypothetical protein
MTNVVLTLGTVAFQNFEVPEKIVFGGTQRLAVQPLIGGGRVVNVLGYDDGAISFAGIFAGSEAAQRAQTLDVARAAGAVLPLIWDQFYYNVIIASFAADYQKPWWIPFALSCVVTRDPVTESGITPASYLIGDDLAVATALLGQAGIPLAGLSNPTASGLAVAQGMIAGAIVSAGTTLNGSANAVANAADATTGIAAVNQLAATSGALAAAAAMSGYVNRAATNLVGQLS